MGWLDATPPVAHVENQLACRDRSAAHLIGDAVGFAGLAVEPKDAITVDIEPVPPDKARTSKRCRAVSWRGVNGGVVGLIDGAGGSSRVGYA